MDVLWPHKHSLVSLCLIERMQMQMYSSVFRSSKQVNFPIYYIDTDEIPGFSILLKIESLSRAVKILFYLAHVKKLMSAWLLTWLANKKFQKWIKKFVVYHLPKHSENFGWNWSWNSENFQNIRDVLKARRSSKFPTGKSERKMPCLPFSFRRFRALRGDFTWNWVRC